MDFSSPGALWLLGVLAGFFFALFLMRMTRCKDCCQVKDCPEVDDNDPAYWHERLGRREEDRK